MIYSYFMYLTICVFLCERIQSSEWLYLSVPSLSVPVRLEEAAGTQKAVDTFPARYHLQLTERDK